MGVSLRISKLKNTSILLNVVKKQIEELIFPYNYGCGNESLEEHVSNLLLKAFSL